MDLIGVLKELVKCLKGKWFIGDGALLGIIRQGGLISYDNDIDIYILEDTEIDLNDSVLKRQKYYMCDKVYYPDNKKEKLNTWREYCSYIKFNNQKLNRTEVLKLASKDYKDKKIIPEFTKNHIDIFTLKKGEDGNYHVDKTTGYPKSMTTYYTEDDLNLQTNNCLGFEVNIPNNAEAVLERTYGKDWKIPNPLFSWY